MASQKQSPELHSGGVLGRNKCYRKEAGICGFFPKAVITGSGDGWLDGNEYLLGSEKLCRLLIA
jgi:hypothetical protein